MGARDRVRDAIQGPVDAAEHELRELQGADVETRLTVLIDGWARGLAAALEELAISIDELERDRATEGERDEAKPVVEEPAAEPEDRAEELDLAGASEERLVDEARRSRAATARLQEEGEEARRRVERGGR